MENYLTGKSKTLGLKPDLQGGTAFQKTVWKALRKIPFGKVKSYAWVAKKINRPKAFRAVGQACGANPLPLLFPCHRVVASSGKIGGFSGGPGWKRRLLRLEKPDKMAV